VNIMLSRMTKIEAPIKINLALHVTGQEANGYHLLQSLVVFSGKGDELCVVASSRDEVHVEGEYGCNLGTGRDNLIVKARDMLRAEIGKTAFPIVLKLVKNLPLASGLGGGSADAAATLLALVRLWCIGIDEKRLYDLARHIGADVPMCLHAMQHSQALLASGIGDKMTPLPQFPSLDMVLVNPHRTLSTAMVFRHLAQKTHAPFILESAAFTSIEKLVDFLKPLRNDLYLAAHRLMPEISQIPRKLEESGAMLARMSGSGASFFGIYANQIQAQEAEVTLKRQNPGYFVKAIRTFGKKINEHDT